MMNTFCHPLKPTGYLHVRIDENYLDLIILLKDRAISAGVSLDASPEAKQLLEPCDVVEVIFQKNKIAVLVNDEPVIRNKVTDPCEVRDALARISQSFCELSRAHAETLGKRRDAKDVKEEALELLNKIDERHQKDFTKFILILNEKKKKIRELQRRLGIRTDDPEDIEDEIGLEISVDGSPRTKKARVSDQLALEGPSTSSAEQKLQKEGDAGKGDEVDQAEDVHDEDERPEDVDDDFLSDDEHSDRAPSEPEEIDEDDAAPPVETSPMKEKEGEPGKEDLTAIKVEIKEEKMSIDDSGGSECDTPSRKRPLERQPQPKKTSLDMLDDLL